MADFDLVVIGGGPAGYVGAAEAARAGMKVALVDEHELLGGTCLRVGCIPSKALLESSAAFHDIPRLADRGIEARDVSLKLDALLENKQRVVETVAGGVAQLMKRWKVTVIRATAKLSGKNEIALRAKGNNAGTLSASRILLATGSLPVGLPAVPFDGQTIVSSNGALAFRRVPENLAVIGGGAVGLELGQVWANLGSKVTVIEMLDRIVPFADGFGSRMLARSLKGQGMEILTATRVTGCEVSGKTARISYEGPKGDGSIECAKVLVAVGRRPRTHDIGLEQAGIDTDDSGRVVVDSALRTSAEGIWAVGDITPGPMLAHKASYDARVAVAGMLGEQSSVDYGLVPSVIYCRPELAQVGLTSEQCKAQGIDFASGRAYFQANGRAVAAAHAEGAVQLLAAKPGGRLLGACMVGPMVSELSGIVQVALAAGMTVEQLAGLSYAHPSYAETLGEAAREVAEKVARA